MIVLNEKQIGLIKPHCNGIAKSCGVSGQYVHMLARGERRQNTERAKNIMKKIEAILQIVS